jgi:hypothetical protein
VTGTVRDVRQPKSQISQKMIEYQREVLFGTTTRPGVDTTTSSACQTRCAAEAVVDLRESQSTAARTLGADAAG